jgi:hypothetical protein
MGVILMANVRAARTAKNLAESLSSDPMVRRMARQRAIAELNRREKRLKEPRQLAEVVVLRPRMAKRLRGYTDFVSVFEEDY